VPSRESLVLRFTFNPSATATTYIFTLSNGTADSNDYSTAVSVTSFLCRGDHCYSKWLKLWYNWWIRWDFYNS
jgi:hypothetical protein